MRNLDKVVDMALRTWEDTDKENRGCIVAFVFLVPLFIFAGLCLTFNNFMALLLQ
jgi:hypothetical protein